MNLTESLNLTEVNRISLDWFQTSLNHSCLLADVGVDESLLEYSGLNSTARLQGYSDRLSLDVPGFAAELRPALGSVARIPNAVGLNALVISLILDAVANRSSSFYRTFGEEEAAAAAGAAYPGVYRTMTAYVKRHRRRVNDDYFLRYELQPFELQLSEDLVVLWNTLSHDGIMSSRTLKSWTNAAWFRLLMLVHDARLHSQRLRPGATYCTKTLSYGIDLFMDDLEHLLGHYRRFRVEKTEVSVRPGPDGSPRCFLVSKEREDVLCEMELDFNRGCSDSEMIPGLIRAYVGHMVSRHEAIVNIKSQALNVQKNLGRLIDEHDVFTLPQTTS